MLKNYKTEKNKLLTSALDDGCQRFFAENNYLLELAYSKLLKGKPQDAKVIFQSIQDKDVRAHWGLLITNILTDSPAIYPSYFEIRNFLEIDLNIFIIYGKGDYVEKILDFADVFSSVNLEVYKYIGRVFWNNNLFDLAKFFLERAKNHFFQDPELHYILACLHQYEGDFEKTLSSLDNCLKVMPGYFPAAEMKRKLTAN